MTNAAENRTIRSRFGNDRRVTCLRLSFSPAPPTSNGTRGTAPTRPAYSVRISARNARGFRRLLEGISSPTHVENPWRLDDHPMTRRSYNGVVSARITSTGIS